MALTRASLNRIKAGVTGQPNRTQPNFVGDGKSAKLPQRKSASAGLPATNTQRNGKGPTPSGARGPARIKNDQGIVTNQQRNSQGGPGLVSKPSSKGSANMKGVD